MKYKEVSTWTLIPTGGLAISRVDFDILSIDDILSEINYKEDYLPYGYNYAVLSRDIKSIFLYRQ